MKLVSLRSLERLRPRGVTKREYLHMHDVPQVKEGIDVFLRWSYGGYDGTCCGVCEYADRICAYQNFVSVEARIRAFAILALSDEEAALHVAYARRREELLGESNTYTYVDGRRKRGPFDHAMSSDERKRRYDTLKTEFPQSFGSWSSWDSPHQNNIILAWFQWGPILGSMI